MRAFAFCHDRAMRSRWTAALIQSRGFARLSVHGLRDAEQHLPRASNNNSNGDGDGDDIEENKKRKHKRPSPQVVFSGIQPTGIPHLGNYLGALRPWVELQNSSISGLRCLFCVVDLHALTSSKNAEQLARWRKESFASLLAVGLDYNKSAIFMQSDVRHHSELMWILSAAASTGQLSRMTQWKRKLELPENASLEEAEARARLKLGLFSYPVLQAADILLYKADRVPVGEDQVQHVEFARDLAKSFNHTYGDAFNLPEASLSPAKRIMSLKEPQLKMSKSHADPKSRILITDSEEEIHSKIRDALTDSESGITYDPKCRPGVSNLLEILKHTTQSSSSCEELANDLSSLTMRQLKDHVSQAIVKCLGGIRESYLELMLPSNSSISIARQMGTTKAHSRSSSTMSQIRKCIGLGDEDWPEWPQKGERQSPGKPISKKDPVRDSSRKLGEGKTAQRNPSPSYVQLDQKIARTHRSRGTASQ